MQPLLAPPRESLTADQVTRLLSGPTVRVQAGLDLLDQQLRMVDDLSADLVDGSVSRNNDATIHGTARLQLAVELDWATALLRPYLVLDNGVVTARFNLGVYIPTTPERAYADTPATFDVSCYDRLYLLRRQAGRSYSVAAGGGVLAAVRQVIADAGLSGLLLDGTAEGETLPRARTWPLLAPADGTESAEPTEPATWLRVVNDLLGQVSYRGVWADWEGQFRGQRYDQPSTRGVEWVLDEGAATIQGEDRTLVADDWARPNRWVFVQSNRPEGSPEPTEGDGVYTVDRSANDPRGLVWSSQVSYDVTSQAALVSLGDRRVTSDLLVSRQWQLRGLGPLPLLWHYDVLSLTVDGVERRVQAAEWSMSLRSGLVDLTVQEV